MPFPYYLLKLRVDRIHKLSARVKDRRPTVVQTPPVGTNTTADRCGGFQHQYRTAGGTERTRCAQAGYSRPYDDTLFVKLHIQPDKTGGRQCMLSVLPTTEA